MNSKTPHDPVLPTLSSGRENMSDQEVIIEMIPFCEDVHDQWFKEGRWGFMILPDLTSPRYKPEWPWYYITLTNTSLDRFQVTPPPSISEIFGISRAYANKAGAKRFATLQPLSNGMLLRLESKSHGSIHAMWVERDGELCFDGLYGEMEKFQVSRS